MRSFIQRLAPFALGGLAGIATAAPVFLPNGTFEAGGADWAFAQANGHTVSYPATGGNPGGHVVIDGTAASQTWFAVLISNGDAPYPLASLGLQAGKTYKFLYDMQTATAGPNKGGIKIESWTATGALSDSGDKRKTSTGTGWASYSEEYTIHPSATHLKVVPLWTSNETVAFDNIGVDNTPAQVLPVVPNSGFETPGGANWAYYTDGFGLTYPATDGNPGGCAVIDATGPGGWGVLVANNNVPIPLSTLGLTAGGTYTFQLDMKVLSGANPGGLKVEFVPGASGDLRYSATQIAALPKPVTDWNTYRFQITLPSACTQIQIVPLWGPGSKVAYDNVKIVLPEPPAPPSASIEQGTIVSWTPTSAQNTYQLEESNNNADWTPVGAAVNGTAVSTAFDATKSRFYRVQESEPGVANAVFNPGFENSDFNTDPADGWKTLAATNGGTVSTASSYTGGFVPNGGTEMLVIESATPAEGPVAAPNTDIRSDVFAIAGGAQYTLTFRAAHVTKIGGANPQFSLFFYDASNVPVGGPIFESFSSVGSTWATVTKTFTAPAGATGMTVGWIQAMGAGNGWQWTTLIDDVSLLVPTDSALVGTVPTNTAAGVRVSWDTLDGATYQVRTSTTLGGWTNFGAPITGDGGIWSITDTITQPNRFYQVIETPR